jgi:hypothetical protein
MAENKQTNGHMIAEDEIKHIPLSDIFVDTDWNTRSVANVMSETSETGTEGEGLGIVGLMNDITNDGQDTPVVVRRTDTAGFYRKTNKPYALVAGFRRYEAVRRLNDDADLVKRRAEEKKGVVPNTANGTIRANVRALSEPEARGLNVRENTLRDDLTTPDLMKAIVELSQKHGWTQNQIGLTVGKVQGYVGKLLRIASVDPDILTHWRVGGEFKGVKSTVRVTTNDLDDISKLDRKEQANEYMRVIQAKGGGVDGKGKDKLWLESAKKQADKIGTLLGELQRVKFLKVTPNVPWIDQLSLLVKVGKGKEMKAREERKLADVAEKAFQAALNREDAPEEEEASA